MIFHGHENIFWNYHQFNFNSQKLPKLTYQLTIKNKQSISNKQLIRVEIINLIGRDMWKISRCDKSEDANIKQVAR